MRWFPFLKADNDESLLSDDLFDEHGPIISRDKVTTYKNGKTQLTKQYAKIQSFPDLFIYLYGEMKKSGGELHHYELMGETHRRKPYFDIDMETENLEYLPAYIINIIVCQLQKMFPEFKNQIMVFESKDTTTETPKKYSYHIVIDKVCMPNYEHCRKLCLDLIKEIADENVTKHIDTKVYSKVQQFRIFYNCKIGSQRKKTLNKQLSTKYFDETLDTKNRLKNMLFASYVTLTGACTLSDLYSNEQVVTKKFSSNYERVLFDITKLDYYIDCMKKTHSGVGFPFKFTEVTEEGFILFKRTKKSECLMCNRIHNNENPFASVTNDKIRFYCRRSDNPFVIQT